MNEGYHLVNHIFKIYATDSIIAKPDREADRHVKLSTMSLLKFAYNIWLH